MGRHPVMSGSHDGFLAMAGKLIEDPRFSGVRDDHTVDA
jgi:hypothetical protein